MKKFLFIVLVIGIVVVLFVRGNAKASPGEYVVQPGDTLAEIAARYGVTVDDLVALNRDRYPSLVERPDRIEVGWRLRVPGRKPFKRVERRISIETRASHANRSKSIDRDAVEREVFRLTNQARVEHGLPPLTWDENLHAIARWRAEDMVKRGYFSHNDPRSGERLIYTRCNCDEDIQALLVDHTRTPEDIGQNLHTTWMNSPPHRAGILYNRATRGGVGIAISGDQEQILQTLYAVLVFAPK